MWQPGWWTTGQCVKGTHACTVHASVWRRECGAFSLETPRPGTLVCGLLVPCTGTRGLRRVCSANAMRPSEPPLTVIALCFSITTRVHSSWLFCAPPATPRVVVVLCAFVTPAMTPFAAVVHRYSLALTPGLIVCASCQCPRWPLSAPHR